MQNTMKIIEMFGNASTKSNFNSSRYGMLTSLKIDPNNKELKGVTFST